MGSQLAAHKTPCTAQQLVDALVALWPSELGGSPSLETVCVLASQWALETGNGSSMVCFNIGNEKCPNPAAFDYCHFTTWEDGIPAARARAMVAADSRCTAKGTWPATDAPGSVLSVSFHPDHPACRFRAFGSLKEGAQVYLRGMWSHWTAAWPFACKGDPEGFAAGLRQQGYYTAPVATYAADMRHYFDIFMKSVALPSVDPLADTTPPGGSTA